MTPFFENKIAIVTGSAGGIGLAAAKALYDQGARVSLIDLKPGSGDPFTSRSESDDRIMYSVCDVSDENQLKDVVEKTKRLYGSIDILVNNAGIAPPFGFAADVSSEDWRRVLSINLDSAFYASKAVIPYLKEQGGAIVNTASVSGIHADRAMSSYNTAKAGLINFTRSLALEYASDGIRVNAVCPGATDTPMATDMKNVPGLFEKVCGNIPMKRMGRSEEIADAILFLASDRASYITGATLVVDGGASCRSGMLDMVDATSQTAP